MPLSQTPFTCQHNKMGESGIMPIVIPVYMPLSDIIDTQWYRPNGREFSCRICNKIEFSKTTIRQHIKEHRIGEMVYNT